MSDHERRQPFKVPANRLRAMHVMEILGALYERAIRGPAWRRLAMYAVARGLGEARARSKFPQAMAWVWIVRNAMQLVTPRVVDSSPVVSRLARNLTEKPVATQARLARWCTAVRVTRLVHRIEWRLSLRGAVLEAVELEGIHTPIWERALLDRASLTSVTVRGSARESVFDGAVLRNVTFVGVAIEDTSWQGAVLQDVIIAAAGMRRSRLGGAVLRDCTFVRVDLRGSDLDGASIARVVFERCDLTGVDLGSVAIEDVDFVACIGVDTSHGPQRTASGALPRSLMARSDGPQLAVAGRYADAMTRSKPPMGYRMQTLLRSLAVWLALGGEYKQARRDLAEHDPQRVDLVLPRSRVWGGLRILLGWDHQDGVDLFVEPVYENVRRAVLALHSEAEGNGRALPQVVVVDGDRPIAELVVAGDRDYLVVSGGLVVLSIRVARYCVGWILPPAISYMDMWPDDDSVDGVRAALSSNLEAFVSSGRDVSGLPRIQVTGMRDAQATSLAMTFLAFVLTHEVAHALEARGTVFAGEEEAADRELAADVFACRLLDGEHELDGDAEMLETMRSIDPQDLPRMIRSSQAAMRVRGAQTLDVTDEEIASLDPASEEFLQGVDRFTDSNWYAAAVTVFLMAMGGAPALDRARSAIGVAFGEQVLNEVLAETESEDKVLGMVRRTFA